MQQRSFILLLMSTGIFVALIIPTGILAVWSLHPGFFEPYAPPLDRLLFRIGVHTIPLLALLALTSAWRHHRQQRYFRGWSLCLGAIILLLIQTLGLYGFQIPPV